MSVLDEWLDRYNRTFCTRQDDLYIAGYDALVLIQTVLSLEKTSRRLTS